MSFCQVARSLSSQTDAPGHEHISPWQVFWRAQVEDSSELRNAAKKHWLPIPQPSTYDFFFSFLNTQKQEAERKLIRLRGLRHMRPQLKRRHRKSDSNSLFGNSTTV